MAITNHSDEVYRLYVKRHGAYFVNKVIGSIINALRPDPIEKVRKMARVREKEPFMEIPAEYKAAPQRLPEPYG